MNHFDTTPAGRQRLHRAIIAAWCLLVLALVAILVVFNESLAAVGLAWAAIGIIIFELGFWIAKKRKLGYFAVKDDDET